jgi:hypothetical protein
MRICSCFCHVRLCAVPLGAQRVRIAGAMAYTKMTARSRRHTVMVRLAEILFVAFSVFVLLRVRWGSSISGGVLCAACETSRGKRCADACSKNELRADLPDGL